MVQLKVDSVDTLLIVVMGCQMRRKAAYMLLTTFLLIKWMHRSIYTYSICHMHNIIADAISIILYSRILHIHNIECSISI